MKRENKEKLIAVITVTVFVIYLVVPFAIMIIVDNIIEETECTEKNYCREGLKIDDNTFVKKQWCAEKGGKWQNNQYSEDEYNYCNLNKE